MSMPLSAASGRRGGLLQDGDYFLAVAAVFCNKAELDTQSREARFVLFEENPM